MRLVSWNVNGLRAVAKKGFADTFDELGADVFALQETKLQEGQIDLEFPGYTSYWSYAERKGYSGTAVYAKEEPLQVLHGLGIPHLDTEGRIVALEFPQFWFVDVYTPTLKTNWPASIIAWSGTTHSAISAWGCRRARRLQVRIPPNRNPWSCAATSTWRIRKST